MNKDKLLVVDDDRDTCLMLKEGLEKSGYEVDVFNDPLEALSHFKVGKYDLALLDVRLPKKSGFELYREMKLMDARIKVCFITGFETYQNEFSKVFPSLDIRCCVRKPASIQELTGTIQQVVKCV